MSQLPMTVELLENTYGLTCVENQFIAIMKLLGLPFKAIYMKSYLKLEDTIDLFLKNKIEYANFYGIERLYTVSKNVNIAENNYLKLPFESMLAKLENALKVGVPLVVHVDPSKLPKINNILPWREDHFLSLYGVENGEYMVLDDTPLRMLNISKDILEDAYMGNVFYFKELEGIKKETYIEGVWQNVRDIIHKGRYSMLGDNINELVPFEIEEMPLLRDAIGVLRVSRQRLEAWLGWVDEYTMNDIFGYVTEELAKVITLLNRIYTSIEFNRLRKKLNRESLITLLNDIKTIETDWLVELENVYDKIANSKGLE